MQNNRGKRTGKRAPQEPKERPRYATVTKKENVLPVELSEADKEMVQKCTSKLAEFMAWNRPKDRMVALYFRRLLKIDLASIEDAVRELLPESKIRHRSFIGKSIMEVLTVIEHRRAILDITRAAGMIHMPHLTY